MNNDYISLIFDDLMNKTRYSMVKLNSYHLSKNNKKE